MNFIGSTQHSFECKLFQQDGLYLVYIKLPNSIRSFEYQMLGENGYQMMAREELQKEMKKKNPYYLLFALEEIQILFFQIYITMGDDNTQSFHQFIDMNELYKNNESTIISKKNIQMKIENRMEEKNENESEDDDDDEDTEYETEDEEISSKS